jgi:hypothetical protein
MSSLSQNYVNKPTRTVNRTFDRNYVQNCVCDGHCGLLSQAQDSQCFLSPTYDLCHRRHGYDDWDKHIEVLSSSISLQFHPALDSPLLHLIPSRSTSPSSGWSCTSTSLRYPPQPAAGSNILMIFKTLLNVLVASLKLHICGSNRALR